MCQQSTSMKYRKPRDSGEWGQLASAGPILSLHSWPLSLEPTPPAPAGGG